MTDWILTAPLERVKDSQTEFNGEIRIEDMGIVMAGQFGQNMGGPSRDGGLKYQEMTGGVIETILPDLDKVEEQE